MSTISEDSRKLFYSIGEVAAYFNVNESTLRFWEKEFPKVIKPRKTAKGTRSYTKNDIEDIRLIHFLLKEKGMTIAGARKKIREEKKGMTAQHELANRLKKIKSELLRLQQELGTPSEEAPEYPEFELETGGRLVFAEPGTEMIPVTVPFSTLDSAVLPDEFYDHVASAEEPEGVEIPVFITEIPVPASENDGFAQSFAATDDTSESRTGGDYSQEINQLDEDLQIENQQDNDFQEEEEDQSWKEEYIQSATTEKPVVTEDAPEVPEPERFFRENATEPAPGEKGWKGELF